MKHIFLCVSLKVAHREKYVSYSLLVLGTRQEDLAVTVGATVGAGMMRKTRLFTLWTGYQLWQFQVKMCATLTLTGM